MDRICEQGLQRVHVWFQREQGSPLSKGVKASDVEISELGDSEGSGDLEESLEEDSGSR